MGLDTYATNKKYEIDLTPEQLRAFEEADLQLCGGMLSGHAGSFRGKVYQKIIYEITGEDLYQFFISPAKTKKIYRALAACDPQKAAEETETLGGVNPLEIIELRKFFKICTDYELGLIGSW